MADAAAWAAASVTLLLGVAGFLVARGINRDVRLKLSHRRLRLRDALGTHETRQSIRLAPDEHCRVDLHKTLTDWITSPATAC